MTHHARVCQWIASGGPLSAELEPGTRESVLGRCWQCRLHSGSLLVASFGGKSAPYTFPVESPSCWRRRTPNDVAGRSRSSQAQACPNPRMRKRTQREFEDGRRRARKQERHRAVTQTAWLTLTYGHLRHSWRQCFPSENQDVCLLSRLSLESLSTLPKNIRHSDSGGLKKRLKTVFTLPASPNVGRSSSEDGTLILATRQRRNGSLYHLVKALSYISRGLCQREYTVFFDAGQLCGITERSGAVESATRRACMTHFLDGPLTTNEPGSNGHASAPAAVVLHQLSVAVESQRLGGREMEESRKKKQKWTIPTRNSMTHVPGTDKSLAS
ncbi:hypothetical protein C8F01DRAFT_1077847 [Mycena amicta]|nr:hypothetical protein C8F01DRAFT_1077847 [Mycena amicta]